MNNHTLMITRTRYDETMNYLFYWAGLIADEAKSKNIDVVDLKEEKVTKNEFCGRICKIKPKVIFVNGHGNSDSLTGHNNQVLVQSNDNEKILSGSIIYALSCRSANNLGVNCVANGTKSYIGYNDDFIFIFEKDRMSRPLTDETAGLFLNPSNLIMTSIIKGNSSQESLNRSQKEFKRNIRKLLTNDSPQQDRSAVRYLIWDMTHQVCLGDTTAKL